MKKFSRLGISVCMLAISIFMEALQVSAFDWDRPCFGNTTGMTESISHSRLEDGITKKESISSVTYNFPEELGNNSYRYVTVYIDITYTSDITHKALAIAGIECNFRYNAVTRECECLSTSGGNISPDPRYVLNVFSRKSNISTENGGGLAEIKFKHNGKTYEERSYNVSCDYNGKISLE